MSIWLLEYDNGTRNIYALISTNAGNVVDLTKNKKAIDWKCVYKIKFNAHDSIEWYKVCLVAKGN